MKRAVLLAVAAVSMAIPAGAGTAARSSGVTTRVPAKKLVIQCKVSGRVIVDNNSNVSAAKGICRQGRRNLPVSWFWRASSPVDDHGNTCSLSPSKGSGRTFFLATPPYSLKVSFRVLPARRVKGKVQSNWSKPQTVVPPKGWTAQCAKLPQQLPQPATLCAWTDTDTPPYREPWNFLHTHSPNCGVAAPGGNAWISPLTFDPSTLRLQTGNVGTTVQGCSYWPWRTSTWFGFVVQETHWLNCPNPGKSAQVGMAFIRLEDSGPNHDTCQIMPLGANVTSFRLPPTVGGKLYVAAWLNPDIDSRTPYWESETGGPWALPGTQSGCAELLKIPHYHYYK